jgi:hypothetical protein
MPRVLRCCSVCQWSRQFTYVASGAAPTSETYTIRGMPASSAAAIAEECSASRRPDRFAEMSSIVSAPASAARIASVSM